MNTCAFLPEVVQAVREPLAPKRVAASTRSSTIVPPLIPGRPALGEALWRLRGRTALLGHGILSCFATNEKTSSPTLVPTCCPC